MAACIYIFSIFSSIFFLQLKFVLNFVNFRHCNFFVSANNKRKLEEQRKEEFYTSSLEEIPNNGSIADAIIQQYKRRRIKMS